MVAKPKKECYNDRKLCLDKGKRNMDVTFESLGLSPAMLKALEQKGYGYPTTIQAEAIPHFMQWKDVIAKAPTGTGLRHSHDRACGPGF